MLAHVSTFFVPKRGCSVQEYEDASWVGPDGLSSGQLEGPSLRVAVSDGASASLLASRWARRLVCAFGTARDVTKTKAGFLAAYREAAGGWDAEVARYIAEREERSAPIQWYEEPGLARGAHATIVALDFREAAPGQAGSWRAVGLGDSCVFQVRDEALRTSFPVSDTAGFSYRPPLLASRGADDDIIRRHIARHSADWDHGDSFYVMTDALAAWFLRKVESGGRPWEPLRGLGAPGAFSNWVDGQRDSDELHDDDTTLVRIEIH